MALNCDDPCAVYRQLRETYFRLLSGQQEYEFEYLGNGVQRRVRYSSVDMAELKQAMDEAKLECQSGATAIRRVAIQGGSLGRTPLSPFRVLPGDL
jgi:hypothetical protein